ncbi:DUF2939 domain-containing protein [Luteimonas vadosa]|uniref:DUF2939 domain-containing protein n=1 Tax=Luteimonas vadosa TaxID=1165507 RepID=A0ABP9E217_9GAMM
MIWLSAAVLAMLLAYAAAGPYLAINAIRDAIKTEDTRALAAQVDFPALRTSLKAQLTDHVVREAGPGVQSSLLGAFGLRMATGLVGGAVDAMVTPLGLGALMEGRKVWNRGIGIKPPSRDDTEAQPEPLRDAVQRYESPSRFTATVQDDSGRPIVFVLTRKGLRWKLSDIRLPL